MRWLVVIVLTAICAAALAGLGAFIGLVVYVLMSGLTAVL